MSVEKPTPIEMFYQWEANAADQVFLRQSLGGGQWQEYTWADVADRVRRIASFIHSHNFPKGSSIALFSSNSADWIMVDLAIMLSGNVTVPLYPGQDVASGNYIIKHSEAKLIFAGAFDNFARADELLGTDLPRVAMHGCAFDCDTTVEQVVSDYAPYTDSPVPAQDEIMTIVYTSGTTGNPKGAVHEHGTAADVTPRILEAFSAPEGNARERFFSFLPLSHIAERVAIEMRGLYANAEISFSAGLAHFADEMREVQPSFFFAVPRLWVKFKEGVDAKFPPEVQQHFGEAEKAQVRAALGLSKAHYIVTGSAPTPKDVVDWYHFMGVKLREGYGMTENFIDATFNYKGDPVVGTVGHPLRNVELKITEQGEVCFRSRGVMREYFKNPEKTAEVIVDGWYHTGDKGKFDDEGRLIITGRISETFKTSKGKFIIPTELEGKFAKMTEIAQICVFGLGADQPMLLCNLTELGHSLSHEELHSRLTSQLDDINAQLPSYEQVSHFFVTNTEWTIADGLLTPTMKLKRSALETHFSELIARASTEVGVIIQ